jgi:hypothetical protein
MGVREVVNQRPGIVIACAAVAILIALALALMPSSATPQKRSGVPLDWYTIDDGKNWFADDARKNPPFDYQGKTAYRCRVWTCDDGKTKFVSHLERLTPDAKKKVEAMKPEDRASSLEIQMLEVKAPLTGDKGWVGIRSRGAESITTPRCPNGSVENLRPVMPE